MAHGKRVRSLLRQRGQMNVTAKEKDARRIEIECVETPGGKDEGYIVCVTPKSKDNKPGQEHKPTGGWMEPIKRVFATKAETLKYLEEAL